VKRRNVWNPDQKMATNLQTPAHLVKNPEYFLDVLQHLIHVDEIDALAFEGQLIALNIEYVDLINLFPQRGRIFLADLPRKWAAG